jgi:hypothetical protein
MFELFLKGLLKNINTGISYLEYYNKDNAPLIESLESLLEKWEFGWMYFIKLSHEYCEEMKKIIS